MLKTLACKHRSTVTKMARKYKATIVTKHGPRACYEARKERPGLLTELREVFSQFSGHVV